jgi:hypothetical protein
MASGFYEVFWVALALGDVHWDSDTIMAALVDSGYAFDGSYDTETTWVSGQEPYDSEIAGTGYTAGGAALETATVAWDETNSRAKLDAEDVTWAESELTAAGAVLWDDTHANDIPLVYFDFGAEYTSAGGDFTLQWNAAGIITLAPKAA